MSYIKNWKLLLLTGVIVAPILVTGCSTAKKDPSSVVVKSDQARTYAYTARDRECLERAMFFESNRSDRNGLLAVGTVVMNRLASGKYSDTICGVVGQKNQFAPRALSRKMVSSALPDVQAAAEAVLKGKRLPALHNALFFHKAGLKFPYRNIHYVLVAGGNAFYEKRHRDGSLESPIPDHPQLIAAADTLKEILPNGQGFYSASTTPVDSIPIAMETPMIIKPQRFTQRMRSQDPDIRIKNNRIVDKQHTSIVPSYERPQSQMEAHKPTLTGNTSLGFGSANQKSIDAIGEFLLSQDRPPLTHQSK